MKAHAGRRAGAGAATLLPLTDQVAGSLGIPSGFRQDGPNAFLWIPGLQALKENFQAHS